MGWRRVCAYLVVLCWVALRLGWMVGTFDYIGSHVVCVVVEECLEYFHTVSTGKIRFGELGYLGEARN